MRRTCCGICAQQTRGYPSTQQLRPSTPRCTPRRPMCRGWHIGPSPSRFVYLHVRLDVRSGTSHLPVPEILVPKLRRSCAPARAVLRRRCARSSPNSRVRRATGLVRRSPSARDSTTMGQSGGATAGVGVSLSWLMVCLFGRPPVGSALRTAACLGVSDYYAIPSIHPSRLAIPCSSSVRGGSMYLSRKPLSQVSFSQRATEYASSSWSVGPSCR